MLIEYHGHDLFTLTLNDGVIIATDPYSDLCDYPERSLAADVCTVSHDHADHNSIHILRGSPVIVNREGVHHPLPAVTVTGVPTFHDDTKGQKRGRNLVHVIEAEGLRIAHLGDLGHVLSPVQCASIGQPDILFLPVGGYYTIDARIAIDVMRQLDPRVTIPMHYQTRANEAMPIRPVSDFLALLGIAPQPMRLCRVTAEDLCERPSVILMTTSEGL